MTEYRPAAQKFSCFKRSPPQTPEAKLGPGDLCKVRDLMKGGGKEEKEFRKKVPDCFLRPLEETNGTKKNM